MDDLKPIAGFPTGIEPWDTLKNEAGEQRSCFRRLTLLVHENEVGGTTLAMNWAIEAVKAGRLCVFFSFDDPKDYTHDRFCVIGETRGVGNEANPLYLLNGESVCSEIIVSTSEAGEDEEVTRWSAMRQLIGYANNKEHKERPPLVVVDGLAGFASFFGMADADRPLARASAACLDLVNMNGGFDVVALCPCSKETLSNRLAWEQARGENKAQALDSLLREVFYPAKRGEEYNYPASNILYLSKGESHVYGDEGRYLFLAHCRYSNTLPKVLVGKANPNEGTFSEWAIHEESQP